MWDKTIRVFCAGLLAFSGLSALPESAWAQRAPRAGAPVIAESAVFSPSPLALPPALAAPMGAPPISSVLAPAASVAPAAAGAAARLDEARSLLGSAAPSAAGLSRRRTWDRFWSSARLRAPAEDFSAGPSASAVFNGLSPFSGAKRRAAQAPAAVAAAAVAFAPVAAWTGDFWRQSRPYALAAASLLAVYAVNRFVGKAIRTIARRWSWNPNTAVSVSLVATVVIWSGGLFAGLHYAAGVSALTLLKGFGVGGIAATMAAKEFIGNFIAGIKVLLNEPFTMGERVKIGDVEYTVQDMGLRYLELAKSDGSKTMMLYTFLDEKPVMRFREYQGRPGSSWRRPLSFRLGLAKLRRETLANLGKSTAWLALSVTLVAGSWWFKPRLAALGSALPYLKAGLALLAARALAQWLARLAALLAEKNDWSRQTTVVVKLALQAAVYLVGGSLALTVAGVSWSVLLASFGATSLAVGWAAGDIISNLIQGAWILLARPFKIGDAVEIGASKGTVIDMNINYVVLKGADEQHTLVPYSVVKASPLIVSKNGQSEAKSR